jgi:Flp pilus assembly protein TadG
MQSRSEYIGVFSAGGRRHRRGGAVLETAITLSLIMSLTFGMVEFGYCYYCKNMLVGAAREGARKAIVAGSAASDVTTAVANALASTKWPSSYYTVAITDTSNNPINLSTAAVGTQVQVTVSASWGTIGKGFSPLQLISASKQVAGVCVMRKEQ